MGYACVNFENPESALKAVKELNGSTVDGCQLYVAAAQSKEDRKKAATVR